MADLAAGDVTYTLIKRSVGDSGKMFTFSIAFGNSTLTYPSGGVPLTAGSLGCPNTITRLNLFGPSSGDGLIYKYDTVNNKIRIYQGKAFTPAGAVAAPTFTGDALATHTHDSLYIGGITATEAVAIQGGDTLGKNAATNRTIVGANSATKGGVVAVTGGTPSGTNSAPAFTGTAVVAAALSEFVAATTAPAATTIYLEVMGW